MMPKIKTITLSKDAAEEDFRVEAITDSIEYTPGSYMNPADVEVLCAARDWKVKVIRPKSST